MGGIQASGTQASEIQASEIDRLWDRLWRLIATHVHVELITTSVGVVMQGELYEPGPRTAESGAAATSTVQLKV